MIRVILILIIALIIYKIYELNQKQENFINITNPFVDGLSQYQLGASRPDDGGILGADDEYFGYNLPDNVSEDPSMHDYITKSNNVINKNAKNVQNIYSNKPAKLNNNIDVITALRNKSQQTQKINSILKNNSKTNNTKKNVKFNKTPKQKKSNLITKRIN